MSSNWSNAKFNGKVCGVRLTFMNPNMKFRLAAVGILLAIHVAFIVAGVSVLPMGDPIGGGVPT